MGAERRAFVQAPVGQVGTEVRVLHGELLQQPEQDAPAVRRNAERKMQRRL